MKVVYVMGDPIHNVMMVQMRKKRSVEVRKYIAFVQVSWKDIYTVWSVSVRFRTYYTCKKKGNGTVRISHIEK